MQLAQLNIAESRYLMTDARMDPFTGPLKAIQALAERSTGFVWRDLTDGTDADFSDLKTNESTQHLLINISVWASLKSLFAFTYKTAHAKVMRDNKSNFNTLTQNHYVLWWIENDNFPTGQNAKDKLQRLRSNGACSDAFTFKQPFDETGKKVNPIRLKTSIIS